MLDAPAILVWRVNLVLLDMNKTEFARLFASVPLRPLGWLV